MTLAIVQSKFFFAFIPGSRRVVEKNSPKQFLLIYFPAAKISTIQRGLFWFFRSIHCGLGWEGRRKRKNREKSVESLWNHHNLLFVDDFQVFIRANKHKNMFLYFHFHGNDFSVFFWRKVREILSVSPSCMNRTFHCCPFVSGWLSLPRFSGQRMIRRGFLFSNNLVCHNFVGIMAKNEK